MQPSALRIVPPFIACLCALLCLCATVEAAPPSEARVLIISIDGLRPDLLLLADTTRLRALIAKGAHTFYANTTDHAVTLPSHTSMLTGFAPDVHGVHWNGTNPELGYPKKPTILELAKQAGYTTALVSGKAKFLTLAEPGTVDFVAISNEEKGTDADTAAAAIEIIREHQPQVMFLHLPEVDSVGHKMQWGSPEQLQAIVAADRQVSAVLLALEAAGVLEKTVIFVTADHGGAGGSHGGVDPRSRLIPWIVSGPGIRAGFDLTRDRELTVNIEDTFATAAKILGIPIPEGAKGKPVAAAFARQRDQGAQSR